jgi:hypothetical protein
MLSPTMKVLYNKIAEAEAAVSVNEKKWLVMHVHVQLRLDEQGACKLCYPGPRCPH